MGKCCDGLYYLQPTPTASFATTQPSFDIWHWRLGHPSPPRLRSITALDSSVSMSNKHQCDICPMAKHSRPSFPTRSTLTTSPFELIHCDIWGSFFVPSNSCARYFLTIVDDFTRCTWVYLMQHKSETKSHLISFCALITT